MKHTVNPVLGEKAAHNGKVIFSLDFDVTPHQLRHTYITNLIHSSVDPKTVQYLAGHESSKITMDIYAKVKYIDGIINNGPKEPTVNQLEQQARNGQPISLMDLAAAIHREERDKRKSVVEQLLQQPKQEIKKTAPKKSAEREL